MLKKMIIVLMLIGSGMLNAASERADSVTQSIALHPSLLPDAMPYLAAVKRVATPSRGMPFNLFAQECFGGFMDQQLLSIADKQADRAVAELEKLVARSAKCDDEAIEQELETAVRETFNALCIFLLGKDMHIAHRGPASKAILLRHDGTVEHIIGDAGSGTNLTRLPYASAFKGVAFLRGMSLTDERVAQIINTSCTITPNPQVIAQALVDADAGDAVAAAYLDYGLLDAMHKNAQSSAGSDASPLAKKQGYMLL